MNIISTKNKYYSPDKSSGSDIVNKTLFYTICTFFTGAFIIVWLYVIAGMTAPEVQPVLPPKDKAEQSSRADSHIQKVVTPTLSHYLIKTTGGKIGIYSVYSDGLTKLEKTLDVHPDSLRKTDKLNFDEGIIINDSETLAHIIEDYVS